MSIAVVPQRQNSGLRDILSAVSLYNDWQARVKRGEQTDYMMGTTEMEDGVTPGLLSRALNMFGLSDPTGEPMNREAKADVEKQAFSQMMQSQAKGGMSDANFARLLNMGGRGGQVQDTSLASPDVPRQDKDAINRAMRKQIKARPQGQLGKTYGKQKFEDFGTLLKKRTPIDKRGSILSEKGDKYKPLSTHSKDYRGDTPNKKSDELWRRVRGIMRNKNLTVGEKLSEVRTAYNLQDNFNYRRAEKHNRYGSMIKSLEKQMGKKYTGTGGTKNLYALDDYEQLRPIPYWSKEGKKIRKNPKWRRNYAVGSKEAKLRKPFVMNLRKNISQIENRINTGMSSDPEADEANLARLKSQERKVRSMPSREDTIRQYEARLKKKHSSLYEKP